MVPGGFEKEPITGLVVSCFFCALSTKGRETQMEEKESTFWHVGRTPEDLERGVSSICLPQVWDMYMALWGGLRAPFFGGWIWVCDFC